jgi:hypothetical protein
MTIDKPADWNEALVWPQPDVEPHGPDEQEFENTGTSIVDGHSPGERWTASIEPARLALLLSGGHVQVVAGDTREDLLAKAKELGIAGRSKMSKEELQAAVEDAVAQQAQQTQQSTADTSNASVLAQDQPPEG